MIQILFKKFKYYKTGIENEKERLLKMTGKSNLKEVKVDGPSS